MSTKPNASGSSEQYPVRWGFVGTGSIATSMARVVSTTPAAELRAVASRDITKAQSFAADHGAARAFDTVADMLASEDLDAVYIATPTSLREEISIAAAAAGKHVLGEKPFASLPSLQRITAACREHGVAFMDATHFVHHPRYAAIQHSAAEMIGQPRKLESRFLISLTNRENIRYDPVLEPLGAVGDLGWYNMRATLEYLAPEAPLRNATTRLQRDAATGAIIAGEGSLTFDDDSMSYWQCDFDAASVDIGLTLSGPLGALQMDNFAGENENHAASYCYMGASDVSIASRLSGAALMFEDFAAAIRDASLREHWMQSSERTQALLDAALAAAES